MFEKYDTAMLTILLTLQDNLRIHVLKTIICNETKTDNILNSFLCDVYQTDARMFNNKRKPLSFLFMFLQAVLAQQNFK